MNNKENQRASIAFGERLSTPDQSLENSMCALFLTNTDFVDNENRMNRHIRGTSSKEEENLSSIYRLPQQCRSSKRLL